MQDRSEQIDRALDRLVKWQNWMNFQWLAYQVIRNKMPDLLLNEPGKDAGADAIPLGPPSSGNPQAHLAASLTASLEKIRSDCADLLNSGKSAEHIIYVTARAVQRRTADDWAAVIRTEFGWELEVVSRSALVADLVRPENAWICDEYLDLSIPAAAPAGMIDRARTGSARTVAALRTMYGIADLSLEPVFRVQTADASDERDNRDLHAVIAEIGARRDVTITGAAGAGKSSALLDLATRLLSNEDGPIPLLIPLADWAAEGGDFTRFGAAESGMTEEEIASLAHGGHVAWLLDGWNELPPESVRDAEAHLRGLSRRFSDAPVIVVSRDQESVPPIPGALQLVILPLSGEGRRHFVETSGLAEPQRLLHVIDNSPELDEITRIPLFLSAAVAVARSGRDLPHTQYEILSAFVDQAEGGSHRTPLEQAARGQHRRYLKTLAAALIARSSVRIRLEDAIEAVARCSAAMVTEKMIGQALDAAAVVRTLIDHHLLVAYGGRTRTVGFVHQRFQEWFGAEHLARKLERTIQEQKEKGLGRFQAEVLDRNAWKESLRFLAERLTVEARDELAADLIRMALPVDVVLAAELCAVVSEQAWEAVKDGVVAVLNSLYADQDEDVREYALMTMAVTERSDFADVMWSLLDSQDDQTRFRAYDVLGMFGPGSLGRKWDEVIRGLDEGRRAEFVAWVGARGNGHVGRIVVHAVEGDTSPLVRAAAIGALVWHGYDEEAVQWIRESDSALAEVADLARDLTLLPEPVIEELAPWVREALSIIPMGRTRVPLLHALAAAGDAEAVEALKEEVKSVVPVEEAERSLPILRAADPAWLSDWVLDRMCGGHPWNVHWLKDVRSPSAERVEAVLEAAFAAGSTNYNSQKLISAAADLDPEATASSLARRIAQVLSDADCHEDGERSLRDRLLDSLRGIGLDVRASAILSSGAVPSAPSALAFLLRCLVPWGPEGAAEARALVTEKRAALRTAALTWSELLTNWTCEVAGVRADLALLLGAVGLQEDVDVLMAWIRRDLDDATQVFAATGRPRVVSYCNLYVDALIRMDSDEAGQALLQLLKDPEYVGEASRGLATLALGPEKSDAWLGRRWQATATAQGISGEGLTQGDSHQYGRGIAAALHRHLDARGDSPGARPFAHDLGTAVCALARLDAVEAFRVIPRLQTIEWAEWGILGALELLAASGHVVPLEVATPTVDRIIENFEKGRLGGFDQGSYTVVRALSVLLLSSDPNAGVTRCHGLEPHLRRSYAMRDLIERLGFCVDLAALRYLEELLDNPDVGARWRGEILSALARHGGSEGSDRLLQELDSLAEGNDQGVEGLGDALRSRAERDPEFRNALLRRVKDTSDRRERSLLATVVGHLEGEDAAIAACFLLSDEAPEIPYGVRSRIEDAFAAREEVGYGGGYRLLPKSCGSVRTLLFDLMVSDPTRRESARRALLSIEKMRLEGGRPEDEPRHPNWSAAPDPTIPWPVWRRGHGS